MNRRILRETYYEASASLSNISRQLCFAGIAVIWMLKTQSLDSVGIPFSLDLLLPLYGFVVSLALDLFQYVYRTLAFGIFNRWYEIKGVSEKANFTAPLCINWPTLLFFTGKVAFTICSYYLLLSYIYDKLI